MTMLALGDEDEGQALAVVRGGMHNAAMLFTCDERRADMIDMRILCLHYRACPAWQGQGGGVGGTRTLDALL